MLIFIFIIFINSFFIFTYFYFFKSVEQIGVGFVVILLILNGDIIIKDYVLDYNLSVSILLLNNYKKLS